MLKISPNQIDEAVTVLRRGGIIVYPTETSYGVGCDATNDAAVARLFELKGRPEAKGTTVLIANKESVANYIEVSEEAEELMDKYWPGALNIIAKVAQGSPISERCSQSGTQSVRVSSNPVVAELVSKFGRPLVSSSANLSGSPDVYNVEAIELKVDLIIDGGPIEKRPPSTNVKVIGDKVEIVRQGEIRL